jgi:RNA polymerase sigma-70 factor (ECF subfamily)
MNLDNIKITEREKKKKIFIEAHDKYLDQIYRFIYFKVGNKEEAEDLSSSTFLKVWNYLQNSKIKEKTLRAFIYRTARNTVIDFYRSKNYNSGSVSLEMAAEVIDEKLNIEKAVEIKLDFSLIENKLKKLKDEYREVIILRFTEDLSIGEIADILEKPKGSVRVLVYRALKALKEIMNQ